MIKRLSQVAAGTDTYKKPISTTLPAIVSDVTRPLYRQKESNYIVMLKVIDQSLNNERLFGVMSKDCTIYLISKHRKDIQFVHSMSIGEIVLLDKFSFSLWNDVKLEAKYQGITEGIYVVRSDPENKKKFIVVNGLSMNPDLMIMTPELAERVQELEKWRETEMNKFYQPKLGVKILNIHCVMVQPFNMILKVVSVAESKGEGHERMSKKRKEEQLESNYTIYLTDYNKNEYFLKFPYGNFTHNDIVLIRGIKTIGQSMQIILTSPGNILTIKYPIDPQVMNYMAIFRDNEKLSVKKKCNDFSITNCQSIEKTDIWDLVQLQDKYDHSMKKADVVIRDAYLLEAIVVAYSGHLHLYHRDYQVLLHQQFYDELTTTEKDEIREHNKIGYVYEGCLKLIDRSNQSKAIPFNLQLFTPDSQGNFLNPFDFEVAENAIGTIEQAARQKELEMLIQQKLKRMKNETDFQRTVSLAIEPVRSEKLLFRLVNTKFL